MTAPHTLTTTRARILAMLRQMGHATVDELVRQMPSPPARTTVAAFLQKAHIRGRVARRQEGVAFRYWLSDMPEPPVVVTEAEPFVPLVRYRPDINTVYRALLSPTVWVLWAIAREPGMTEDEIADAAGVDAGNTAGAVNALDAAGIIEPTNKDYPSRWRVVS